LHRPVRIRFLPRGCILPLGTFLFLFLFSFSLYVVILKGGIPSFYESFGVPTRICFFIKEF
jgi:hypothetical protein